MVCDELTQVPIGDDGVARCGGCGTVAAAAVEGPLFVVVGASGSGKTAVIDVLASRLPDVAAFDGDVLLDYFGSIDQHFGGWLTLGWTLARQGKRVAVALSVLPATIDHLPERRLWRQVTYINLDCTDLERTTRLRARPAWRDSSSPETIERMCVFAAALREQASITIDTTGRTVDDVADEVTSLICRSGAQ